MKKASLFPVSHMRKWDWVSMGSSYSISGVVDICSVLSYIVDRSHRLQLSIGMWLLGLRNVNPVTLAFNRFKLIKDQLDRPKDLLRSGSYFWNM